MLIEIPYRTGDIVSFKLSSGEEILGRLDEEGDKNFTVLKPMVLIMGQQGLGLAPFMFSVSPTAKFTLRKGSVSCVAKTEEEIAKQYIAQTTGIQI